MPRVFLHGLWVALTAAAVTAATLVALSVPAAAEVCVKRNGATLACVSP